MVGLMAILLTLFAWAREDEVRNTWVEASPGRQEQIQAVVKDFLEDRARMEWMYDDVDLTSYLVDGGTTSEHLQFFLDRTKLFATFREENGIRREGFTAQYTFGKISYQGIDDTYYVDVTEEVTYRILDGIDMDTYISTEFQVTLKETEEGFRILDVYDPEDWFTAEYEDTGFDYEETLADYTGDHPVEADILSEPDDTVNPGESTISETIHNPTFFASNSGTNGASKKYVVNTYRPYRPLDAICYANTYSANDGNKNAYYNPLFYYHYQTDCINFGSQCIWAGFQGSNDEDSIKNHAVPMDAGGTWQWYGREVDDKDVSYITWRSNKYFNRYMEGMNASGASEAGILSRIIELPQVSGSGNGELEVEPFGLLGSVMQVKGGSTDYAHAIFVVGINPTKARFTRNEVYFCSHTNNRRNACLGDWFPTCKIRIFEPYWYREVSYCTQPSHTYSRMTAGTGSDATCNNCGYVRMIIDPYMIKPVTKGSRATIGGTANILCDTMKIVVKTPSGAERVMGITRNQRIFHLYYTFQEKGLYEITVYATDKNSNVYADSVTRSVTYTVRVN